MNALNEQIGGDHYKTMKVQPLEATYNNFGYQGLRAAVYCKVDKYLRREKGTLEQQIEDIAKARHVLEIQEEFALKELAKQQETKTQAFKYALDETFEELGIPVVNIPLEKITGAEDIRGIPEFEETQPSYMWGKL